MKTYTYIILGIILFSLVISSFSFSQEEKVIFCESYTLQELISMLDSEDRLFTLVHTDASDPESSRIGTCAEADLKQLWEYVQSDPFKDRVPEDLILAAGAEARDQMIPIYAIRRSSSDPSFPKHHDLKEVSVSKSENEEDYALLITFSESGAAKWASMTRLNKGRDIAMLFKDKVIAAPRVTEEIKHGKCMISGKFTESEINKLKTALEN